MSQYKNIKGGVELQKFFDQLPSKIEGKIMAPALMDGANVIRAEAQAQLAANGNVQSGELSRGLQVSAQLSRGLVTVSITAKGKHGFIAHWIEFTGAAPHLIKGKKGKPLAFAGGVYAAINHPGFAPKPFMRPALDGKAGAALGAVGEAIKKRLTTEGLNAPDIQVTEE